MKTQALALPTRAQCFASRTLLWSVDPDEMIRFWSQVAQPSVISVLSPTLEARISGIRFPGFSVMYVETSGVYRLRTSLDGRGANISLLQSGTAVRRFANQTLHQDDVMAAFLPPGFDVVQDTHYAIGFLLRLELSNLQLIRLKATPHRLRQALPRLLSPEDTLDLFHLCEFLAGEVDRYGEFDPELPPAQVATVRDALASRSAQILDGILGRMPSHPDSTERVLVACDRLVERTMAQPLSASQIASEVGWSVRRLYRAFALLGGCTPGEYHRRCRLLRARSLVHLMDVNGLTLRDIATQVGYKRVASFVGDYESEFGCPPIVTPLPV